MVRRLVGACPNTGLQLARNNPDLLTYLPYIVNLSTFSHYQHHYHMHVYYTHTSCYSADVIIVTNQSSCIIIILCTYLPNRGVTEIEKVHDTVFAKLSSTLKLEEADFPSTLDVDTWKKAGYNGQV